MKKHVKNVLCVNGVFLWLANFNRIFQFVIDILKSGQWPVVYGLHKLVS